MPKQDRSRELRPSVKKLLVVIRKEPQESDGSSLLGEMAPMVMRVTEMGEAKAAP